MCRGVIQGDIMSPVLLILTLDQLVQDLDTEVQGIKVDKMMELWVPDHVDDTYTERFKTERGVLRC